MLKARIDRGATSGAGKLGCLFIIFIVALLWAGGQKLYTSLTNRQPTTLSYEDYVKARPGAIWLNLTNCVLDIPGSTYLYRYVDNKNPTEYFIPIHTRIPEQDKVYVLLQTHDPVLLATIEEMKGLKSEEDATAWLEKNLDRVYPNRVVRGMVRFGIDLKDSDRKALAKVNDNIVEDFVIIEENAEPSLLAGAGLFTGGIALVIAGFAYSKRRRNESA